MSLIPYSGWAPTLQVSTFINRDDPIVRQIIDEKIAVDLTGDSQFNELRSYILEKLVPVVTVSSTHILLLMNGSTAVVAFLGPRNAATQPVARSLVNFPAGQVSNCLTHLFKVRSFSLPPGKSYAPVPRPGPLAGTGLPPGVTAVLPAGVTRSVALGTASTHPIPIHDPDADPGYQHLTGIIPKHPT